MENYLPPNVVPVYCYKSPDAKISHIVCFNPSIGRLQRFDFDGVVSVPVMVMDVTLTLPQFKKL